MNTTTRTNTALLLIRLMLAAVFMFHGSQKLFGWFGGYGIEGTAGFMGDLGIPFPTLGVSLAASAEFFGGLALLMGVGVRIASVPMTFTMLVASFLAHGGAFDGQKGGMEYPLTLAVFLVALALLGPGEYTATRLVRNEGRADGIPLES